MPTEVIASRIRRLGLASAIVVWTLIAWGGRVGLLDEGEPAWAWVRIGGSLILGLLAAIALVSSEGQGWTAGLIGLFAAWTVVVWSRSLIINWLGYGSLSFKLVHTVLASGFFTLAWLAWRMVTRRAAGSPALEIR